MRRRRPKGWTEEEYQAFELGVQERLNALLAECLADEAVGRRLAEAWLAGRPHAERSPTWYQDVRSDGQSAYVADDCIATWQRGPRRLYDPDVVLLSGRRLLAGGFEIRVRSGFQEMLEERGIPIVRVTAPYPHPYLYKPEQLTDSWEASQGIVHLLETRAHESAARDLVWAWAHGDDAVATFPHHKAETFGGHIYADEACLLTRLPPGPGEPRPVLLSARRYARGTFRRLMSDAIRAELGKYEEDSCEVRPFSHATRVGPGALWEAWWETTMNKPPVRDVREILGTLYD